MIKPNIFMFMPKTNGKEPLEKNARDFHGRLQFIVKKKSWICPLKFYSMVRSDDSIFLHSGKTGRYSIIGARPFFVLQSKNGLIEERHFVDEKQFSFTHRGDLLEILRRKIFSYAPRFNRKSLPDIPFFGGALGFLSYDFGLSFEGIQQRVRDDLQTPDCYFIFPSQIYVFDHEKKIVYVMLWGENMVSLERNLTVIDSLFQNIERGLTPDFFQNYNVNRMPRPRYSSLKDVAQKVLHKVLRGASFLASSRELESNLSKDQYFSKIERIREYIRAGETYQVNFSQRFSFPFFDDPYRIFERLTFVNPSPFQAYFECPDMRIVSCSPERLVSVKCADFDGNGGSATLSSEWVVETRPIKGTISRGKTLLEDEQNKKMLLASVKDNAELSMIVDLARNDLGRVCRVGTIEVNEHRVLEGYSHVWHTVSNVRGILERGKDFVDVIRAVFPGGSITGCPKKRTMEIIDELEDFKRGVYCGSAGYIGFDGAMDLNIMIRTLVHKNGKVYFHSGGGIVFDSDPEKEYQETLDKVAVLKESMILAAQ